MKLDERRRIRVVEGLTRTEAWQTATAGWVKALEDAFEHLATVDPNDTAKIIEHQTTIRLVRKLLKSTEDDCKAYKSMLDEEDGG